MRPKHFDDYSDIPEIISGVFVDPGNAVYIVDDEGEIVSWNADEWAEDSEAVTATANACILASVKGAKEVRENIRNYGSSIRDLQEEIS